MKWVSLFMCMVGLLVGCEGNEDTVDDGNSLNWSLFRGDASLSGYTDRSLPKKPSLLWSYKSGVRTVSSPIVHQGTTYWCDKKGYIWGIDLKGEPVFGYDLNTPVEAIPMVYDSVLYRSVRWLDERYFLGIQRYALEFRDDGTNLRLAEPGWF